MSKLKARATFLFFDCFFQPLWVVIPLCLLGAILRVRYYLSVGNFNPDELQQIDICKLPFMAFFQKLPTYDFCGYLNGDYFLTYPFYKIFGPDRWGLAIPHIFSFLGAIVLLYLICKSHMKTWWGYVIVFSIFNFNATLITHAFEIRPYAVLPTIALGAFYLMSRLYVKNFSMRLGQQMWVGLLFILTIWFHPYGIFMLFFSALYFSSFAVYEKKFWGLLKNIGPLVIIVLTVSLPVWLLSVFGGSALEAKMKDIFQYIPHPVGNPIGFLKGVFGNLLGCKPLYFLMLGAFFPFVFPLKDRRQLLGMFCVFVLMPIALIFVLDVINGYWFLQRQFGWVMPFYALFLAKSWESAGLFWHQKRINASQAK